MAQWLFGLIQVEKVQAELDGLAATLKQVELYNEQMKGEIAVTRRCFSYQSVLPTSTWLQKLLQVLSAPLPCPLPLCPALCRFGRPCLVAIVAVVFVQTALWYLKSVYHMTKRSWHCSINLCCCVVTSMPCDCLHNGKFGATYIRS